MDDSAVIAAGKSRELLAQLRRNLRFSRWGGSFSPTSFREATNLGPSHNLLSRLAPAEHQFVQELKHLRRLQGDCTLSDLLKPFLDIIKSPEANGVITSAALQAVEELILNAAKPSDVAAITKEVIAAVASCRFEPTDPNVDEVVLSNIVEVLSLVITQHNVTALDDASFKAGFETCFRLSTSKRASPLIVSVAIRALSSIAAVSVLFQTLEDEPKSPPATSQMLRDRIRTMGAASFSFDAETFPQHSGAFSSVAVESILLFASSLVDPVMKQSTALKMTGLQILGAILGKDHCDENGLHVLTANERVRQILLRDVTVGILRTLGLVNEPSALIAQAFTVALSLLRVLGPYGLPLLGTLLQRVFFTYVRGAAGNTRIPAQNREVALEAMAFLMAQPGLLSGGFAAIDCQPRELDAVGPLIQEVEACVRLAVEESHRLFQAGPELVDNSDEVWSSLIAPGLLCADGLLSLADWLGERIVRSPGDSADPGMLELLESKRKKDECDAAAQTINELGGKASGRDCLRILAQHHITEEKGSTGSQNSNNFDHQLPVAAQFFRDTPTVDKNVIGTVLGEPDTVSRGILEHYTNSFEFTSQDITSSVRVFLESFRLPGEAQKIDRIMYSFANRYYSQNKKSTEIKSADVAHVVGYAIVMLNTDQHNDSVKSKMSLDDFIRNSRGTNDGEDFSRQFLLDIFESITALEIKMSNESGLDELSDLLWEEALQQVGYTPSKTGETSKKPRFLPFAENNPASQVFMISWPAITLSSTVALNVALDENEVQRAIEGFLSVAKSSAVLNCVEAIEECVAALSHVSGLSHGSLSGAALQFGIDVRSQLSFVALAGIVRKCGNGIREEGWSTFLACTCRLYCLGLLSSDFLDEMSGYTSDLTDSKLQIDLPRSPLQPAWWPTNLTEIEKKTGERPRAVRRSKTDSSNSFWALLGVGNSVQVEKNNPFASAPAYLIWKNSAEEEAFRLASECIQTCKLEEVLILETRSVGDDSLEALAKALVTSVITLMTHKMDQRFKGSGMVSILDSAEELSLNDLQDAKISAVCFLVDVLTEITLRSQSRIDKVWPHFREVTQWLLANASRPNVATERATVGLLRVAVRLLQLDDIRDDILRGLNLLVNMSPEIFGPVANPVAAGVLHCLREHSKQIQKPSSWHTILSIIERLQRYPSPCFQVGFESLHFLLIEDVESSAVTAESFSPFIDAVLVYAVASVPVASQALDLFGGLAKKIPQLKQEIAAEEETDLEVSRIWTELWKPLLQGISQVVMQSKEWETKLYSITVMERIMASNESEKNLCAEECALAIGSIILPMANGIFESVLSKDAERKMGGYGLKIRQKAVTLVLKTVLQHHVSLYNKLSGEEFRALWLSVLDGTAGNVSGRDGVSEYVTESLKNLLLVMETNKILTKENNLFWDETWRAIKRLSPELYEERVQAGENDTKAPEPEPTEAAAPATAPSEAAAPSKAAAPTQAAAPTEAVADSDTAAHTDTATPTEATAPTVAAAPTEATASTEEATPAEAITPAEAAAEESQLKRTGTDDLT